MRYPEVGLGRRLLAYGRITQGYTTMGSEGFCYLMALNFIPALPSSVLQVPIPWFRAGHPTWQACKIILLVDTNMQALHSGSFEEVCVAMHPVSKRTRSREDLKSDHSISRY